MNLVQFQGKQFRRPGFDPWVGKSPWRRKRLPTPVFWPGEFHGLYSLWGRKELDTNEWLSHFHFNFSLEKKYDQLQFSSVQLLSHVWLFATTWIAARQASLSITNSWVYSNSCPLNWWCHPTISSSVVPFSSCPQSLPASESFPMSQLFAWGGQSTGVSAVASVLPKNTQDWSPLEWTGWNSLQSKGLSRVFSNTTIQMHQFFGAQLSSQSNSHIHTWPLKKP